MKVGLIGYTGKHGHYMLGDGSTFNIIRGKKPPFVVEFQTREEEQDKQRLLINMKSPNKYYVYLNDARGYRDHLFDVEWKIGDEIFLHEALRPTNSIYGPDFSKWIREIPLTLEMMADLFKTHKPFTVTIRVHK